MPRQPPPRTSDTPSIATVADYFRQGRVRFKSAIAAWPERDPAEALIKLHEKGDKLLAVTTRRYFEDDRRVLVAYLRLRKRAGESETLVARLCQAIGRRAINEDNEGNPLPPIRPRTSANKVVDATEYEARTAFNQLKEQALLNRNIHTVMAALFVLVANHSGLRPIELIGAQLDGTMLTVHTAKTGSGIEHLRTQDLSELHSDVILAVELMIQLMPPFINRRAFARWRNRLREALRRACLRGNIRELSLYSFRHVAIATWTRAGLGPREIARLAGHFSVTTARRHYAGGAVGHVRKAIAKPAGNPASASQLKNDPASVRSEPHAAGASTTSSAPTFELEEMPVSKLRAVPKNSRVSAAQLDDAKRKWAGSLTHADTARIGEAQQDRSAPSRNTPDSGRADE